MNITSIEDSTTTAGVTYYGESLKGEPAATDACFQIQAYITATKTWSMANGSAARNLVWANRASYSYP